ncbi:MAG TPA: hypothetical protein VM597_04565 [Gemmataceae bacterium]|nr:hypothetical protein [Gemmataceae bacterium]
MVNDNGRTDIGVHAEDLLPVRSRISWAAIAGGSVLALAVYFLLTLLGAAVGLSIHGNVGDKTLAVGAVVWAVLATAVSLFVGGFVASQLTTGENKLEGALYGLLVWAAVFGMLLWLMASGVRAGFNAIVGVAAPASTATANQAENWEAVARRNGATDAEIQSYQTSLRNAPENIRNAVNDPANRQAAEENATRAAWYSFLGTVVSMLAGIAGGYIGSGPTFRLFPVRATPTMTAARRDALVRT